MGCIAKYISLLILLFTATVFMFAQCTRPVGDSLPELFLLDGIAPPEYKISGQVTGLVGQSLTLGNNTDSVSISPSDSDPNTPDTFAFPETLRTLDLYNISIIDHPNSPTQLCELNSSTQTGQIINNDVADVSVSCQDAYRVDGAISGGVGLQGNGLVLTINGMDSATPSAGNTTFTFASPVSTLLFGTSGSSVSVTSQPQSPWQNCYFGTPGTFTTATATNITSDVTLATPLTCQLNYYNVYASINGLVYNNLIVNINGTNYTYNAGATSTNVVSMASGSIYGISISALPPGQNCALYGGGNGITSKVQGTDIGATISCSVNSYSAGSTITGLSGNGLVIEIQGTLNGGGSFTKNVTLNPGATQYVVASDLNYGDSITTVSITAQPTGPNQYCSFDDGSIAYNYAGGSITNSVTLKTVNCSTNRITGAIAGYSIPSEGLQLQYTDNGTSTSYNLTVTPGDSFSFGTAIGQNYTLSITSNPYNTAYVCTFDSSGTANISGTISSSVTTENITCSSIPAAVAPSMALTPYVNTVTMSLGASGDIICYRTDGGVPACASSSGGSAYSPGGFCAASSTKYTGPIAVVSTTTFKAVSCATSPYMDGSATATFTATISGTVATPSFNPPGGTFDSVQSVSISTLPAGATIYYTTDGSTPTSSSTVYSGPVATSTVIGSQMTIKAIAASPNYLTSGTSASTYTYAPSPTGLVIGLPSGTSLPISWNAMPGASSYRLYRSTSPQNSGGTGIYAGTGTSFTDSGLAYSTTYYYYIIAQYAGGTISSNASSYAPGGTLSAGGMPAIVYGSTTPPGPNPVTPPSALVPNYWTGTKAGWHAGGYTYVIFDPNYQNLTQFGVGAYDSAGNLVNTWYFTGRYITSVTVSGTDILVQRQSGTTTIPWASIYPP